MKTNPPLSKARPSPSYHQDEDGPRQHETLGGVPIQEADNLDETVLGAAALGHPDMVPPEVVAGTGELTAWDEPLEASGTWTPRDGRDDGTLDADRLVEAGIEEADRERRIISETMPD